MLKLRERRIIRDFFFGKVGIIVFLIILIPLIKGTWNMYQKEEFARESRDTVRQELQQVTARKISLEKETKRIATPRGVEEELRQTFDVGHQGEQLIVMVDNPQINTIKPPVTKQTLWYKIRSIFGK